MRHAKSTDTEYVSPSGRPLLGDVPPAKEKVQKNYSAEIEDLTTVWLENGIDDEDTAGEQTDGEQTDVQIADQQPASRDGDDNRIVVGGEQTDVQISEEQHTSQDGDVYSLTLP